MERVEVLFHTLLTWEANGGELIATHRGCFIPCKRAPRILSARARKVPRAGLNAVAKRRTLTTARPCTD
jgi:hypothetical protein